MKQLVQNFKTGQLEILDIPVPKVSQNTVLIESKVSLISSGTERSLVELARGTLFEKVRSQPEKVKEVLQKIKNDGLFAALEAVEAKLDEPLPLGYSNVGVVIDAGKSVQEFSIGDRVVSNGSHAEIVNVSKNLVVRVPDNVDDETASFTVLGSIALEGVRLINPTLGEHIAVIGLGLIGQLVVQLLLASGCKVLAMDLREDRVNLAKSFGAEGYVLKNGESPVRAAMSFSKEQGVDGVVISASTNSNEPIVQAAEISRKRGRIVLVGVAKIDVPRDLFYKKELSFQVSCSYGPGRYDSLYEEKGIDYPLPYVRWTEKRNFEAVLDMMSAGKINVKPLITHRFPFNEALNAYEVLLKGDAIGILLEYRENDSKNKDLIVLRKQEKNFSESPVIGFIGPGQFAKRILLPILSSMNVRLKTIASSSGLQALHGGEKFGFELATSSYLQVFNDPEINTVFIATRHNSHASLVIEALKKGKNVYVEKPLALGLDELKEIISTYRESDKILMVGFNRRFSPFARTLKNALMYRKAPISVSITVNAGEIPLESWVQDPEIGGGRLLGEACHFIDLERYIVGVPIERVFAIGARNNGNLEEDNVVISLSFKDGSVGSIIYFSNGSKQYPKERVEVFNEGKVFLINNFRSLVGFGSRVKLISFRQDKGHRNEVAEFINAIREGKSSPISFEELVEVTFATLAAKESLKIGVPIDLKDFGGII
ncbi:MAG: bi-domain-containing oxidoreductase [Caldisericaceae bacterium]